MSKIMEQINHLQRKAGSYDLLKEEYDRVIQEIKDTINNLNKILQSQGEVKVLKRNKSKKLLQELYDKLKNEDLVSITVETVRKLLKEKGEPDPDKRSYYLIRKLSEMKNINKTKDGRGLRLFYQKD